MQTLESRKEAIRKWRSANRKSIRELNKQWVKNNREKHRAGRRVTYDKNKERIRKYKREKAREYRAKRKANGLCSSCGKLPPVVGGAYCQHCRTSAIAYVKSNRAKKVAAGMCGQCGVKPFMEIYKPSAKSPYCEDCYFKQASEHHFGHVGFWTNLRDALMKQERRCAYSGVPLILGVNASVDHILPVKKFTHLMRDPSNLQWVTKDVNSMKRDHTPEEFLALIELIALHSLGLKR